MKRVFAVWLCAGTLIASDAIAQATTYVFEGQPYTLIKNPTNCTIGECTTFSAGQIPNITLTFSAPLPPNLMPGDLRASVIAYSMNDGVRSASSTVGNAALQTVNIATDSLGRPVEYEVGVQRLVGPPYAVNTPEDPNSRFSVVYATDFSISALSNLVCRQRSGATSQPRRCLDAVGDSGSSSASSGGQPIVTKMAALRTIPTLSEWAMILFGTALAGSAAVVLERRQMAG